jgi:PAS domain S-box-containing protein
MDPKTKLMRKTLAAAGLAVVVMAAGMAAPPFTGFTHSGSSWPAIHLLMELFAVVIAALVVVFSWHSFDSGLARSANILICGFLIVACCDVMHAMTLGGMPPLLGPASTPRSIFFWFMGRSVEMSTMLLLAIAWTPPFSRRFSLAAGFAVSAVLIWFGTYHIDEFPETFVEGRGVTAFKAGYEYALCLFDILVAWLFWKRARDSAEPRNYLLALSSFVMAAGETLFTSYVAPSDFQNVLGHVFKVAAYTLIYRATFVASVRAPYDDARESERRMSESEEKLRGLYELSPLGIALANMQGRFVEFNESFRRMTGYSAEELKALDIAALTPAKYAAEDALNIESLRLTGHYGPYEKERLCKDGSLVPIRLNGMLITGNDGNQYIWSIVEDITDRKAGELAMARERTRLGTILRTASDGIHIISSDGLLIEANDAFLRMLGYDRSAIGRLRVEEWNAVDDLEVIQGRVKILIEGRGTRLFETVHRRKDGSLIDVEINCCAIEIEGQYHVYASSRNVTERKLQQQQLRDLNLNLEAHVKGRTEELAQANRELEAFSYSVSHDLRAPLRALDGFARIINDKEADHLSAEGREMLGRIHANAGKMGALIDDILQFARVGRRGMELVNVDMAAMARDVANDLKAEYPQAEVTIAELPRVRGDAAMLRQVWVNLIGNALKFSSKVEQPRIAVGSVPWNGQLSFFVKDNGAGFDMAHSAKLFQVFHRFHAEREFPGTGAGLAIVKRIVERHAGRIWAESQTGTGAVFHFTLGS